MFYGRFKRSKDTSSYSNDDLACILGGKEKRPKRLKEEEVEESSQKDDSVNCCWRERERERERLFVCVCV